jgi:hypothetical protein
VDFCSLFCSMCFFLKLSLNKVRANKRSEG